jgi:hypothetical protein
MEKSSKQWQGYLSLIQAETMNQPNALKSGSLNRGSIHLFLTTTSMPTPPGADWEKTLYQEIERSKAVIIIQASNWLDSKWCFVEFIQVHPALLKYMLLYAALPPAYV